MHVTNWSGSRRLFLTDLWRAYTPYDAAPWGPNTPGALHRSWCPMGPACGSLVATMVAAGRRDDEDADAGRRVTAIHVA